MRDALIVSTARTPIGKAFRSAFNDTEAPVFTKQGVYKARGTSYLPKSMRRKKNTFPYGWIKQ